MKNKRSVLSDLISGKTDKCCETCKHFKCSNKKLTNVIDGDCTFNVNSSDYFCFNYEVCDDYQENDCKVDNKYFELKDGLKANYCDDPYFDFFTNGLNPEKYLKNQDDINLVNEARNIIKKYFESLKNGNQLNS